MNLTFRAKLLLTMSFLVIGVVGITLLVTEWRVQMLYEDIFRDQFNSRIEFLVQKHDEPLRLAREASQNLVKLVATNDVFLDALKGTVRMDRADRGEQPADLMNRLAQLQLGDAMSRLKDWKAAAPPPDAKKPMKNAMRRFGMTTNLVSAPLARNDSDPFFFFLDSHMQIVRGMENKPGLLSANLQRRALPRITSVATTILRQDRQQVGFLAPPEPERSNARVREVIFTPLKDKSNRPVGVLVMGFAFSDQLERDLNLLSRLSDGAELFSGIWLDGQIYSSLLDQDMRAKLGVEIEKRAGKSADEHQSFLFKYHHDEYHVVFDRLNPESTLLPAYQVCLYSLAPAVQERRELRYMIAGTGMFALSLALFVSLFVARSLAVPISELASATVEIEKGNFNVKVPVRSHDELGRLVMSFNEMAEGLAEKERYRSVLNVVADKNVVAELTSGKLSLGGELREVTVLFCDIRSFTELTHDMPAGEIVQLLNEHMTIMTQVVYEHGGVVDKFVGDLVMALFGAPHRTGEDAYQAARCAVRMIQERVKLNQTSRYAVDIGIGIATGDMVVGCMGSTDRMIYTVIGARVNLASRLCSVAGRMEIMVDQKTTEKLGSIITVETIPPLTLKGFSEPVNAFNLKAVHSQPSDDTP
ncbi:MAG: adenylate/guanylate cyclase domain-containing protein [Verrucomicrobiota bacterium]